LDTIKKFSILLAREIMGLEKFFGIFKVISRVFCFNEMPRKKLVAKVEIGF